MEVGLPCHSNRDCGSVDLVGLFKVVWGANEAELFYNPRSMSLPPFFPCGSRGQTPYINLTAFHSILWTARTSSSMVDMGRTTVFVHLMYVRTSLSLVPSFCLLSMSKSSKLFKLRTLTLSRPPSPLPSSDHKLRVLVAPLQCFADMNESHYTCWPPLWSRKT